MTLTPPNCCTENHHLSEVNSPSATRPKRWGSGPFGPCGVVKRSRHIKSSNNTACILGKKYEKNPAADDLVWPPLSQLLKYVLTLDGGPISAPINASRTRHCWECLDNDLNGRALLRASLKLCAITFYGAGRRESPSRWRWRRWL